MAYNGSGQFNRLYDWTDQAASAVPIRADYMDAEMDGFATGLSNCICKDGQTTITANIGWNDKRITDLADPVDDQDAVNKQYGVATYFPLAGSAATNITLTAETTESRTLSLGEGRTGDGACHVSLIGDATHTTYGLRISRQGGANATSKILHKGTGRLELDAEDATGTIQFRTQGTKRAELAANGDFSFEEDVNLNADTTETRNFTVGNGRAGDGTSQIDLVGDATNADYGLRLSRLGGVNGQSRLLHRGTGTMRIEAEEAALIALRTAATTRVEVAAAGDVTLYGNNLASNTYNQAAAEANGFEFSNSGRISAQRPHSEGDAVHLFTGWRGTALNFIVRSDGDVVNDTGVYGTISDQATKQNIHDAEPVSDDITAIRVREYERIARPGTEEIGIVAQELATIPRFANLVSEEGGLQSVNYYGLIPHLLKAIQELTVRVAALEA